jgi:hypothetical protein
MSQFYSSFTLTLRAVKRFVQSYNMSWCPSCLESYVWSLSNVP